MWSQRESCAVMALLLALAEAAAPFQCHLPDHASGSKTMQVRGLKRNVTFFWHDAPSRAAAALFMAAVSAAGYTDLHLRSTCNDSILSNCSEDFCDTDVGHDLFRRSAVATSWVQKSLNTDCHRQIELVSRAPAHSALRLHVRAPPDRPIPDAAYSWRLFDSPDKLRKHHFLDSNGWLTVYVVQPEHEQVARSCFPRDLLRVKRVTRGALAAMRRDGGASWLLFLDHDLWAKTEGFEPIHLPRRCYTEAGPISRVVDEKITIFAKDIYHSLTQFNPEAHHLRQVLEAEEETHGDVLEVACKWGQDHPSRFRTWIPSYRNKYFIGLFLCIGSDQKTYTDLLEELKSRTATGKSADYLIDTELYSIDCDKSDSLAKLIRMFVKSKEYYSLAGVVTDAAGASAGAQVEARAAFVPTVGVREAEPWQEGGMRVAAGGAGSLASALSALLRGARWSRLALFADDTYETSVLRAELVGFDVKYVNTSGQEERAIEGLRNLRSFNPRIMVLNVEPAKGAALLAQAKTLGMAPESGQTWVSCGGPIPAAELPHLALSFWRRPAEESTAADGDGDAVAAGVVARHWARYSQPLADGLLILLHGFRLFYRDHRQYKDDLHSREAIRLFWNNYDNSPAVGVAGKLAFERGALSKPRVLLSRCDGGAAAECALVDEWRGEWRHRLRKMVDGPPPSDGSSGCLLTAGDPYYPSCYDYTLLVIPVAVVLVVIGAVYARRAYRRHLHEREAEMRLQLQQWKERAAGELASHLVDRAALSFEHRLGEGRFGCVRFAILRLRDLPPRPVAVKALRDGAVPAEESDFLREASMLASLEHENVVCFVGVCAGDGPPLVLMEHAFFGDLLEYLRARRHLAEGAELGGPGGGAAEEAAHVSAAALTRLAREAAAALAYLAGQGVVHRDVRAANCLVDARRTLKLSDFGLARRVGEEAGGEYACHRRGLFPVLWMAPESLKHGVFSAASDVWSFGVLALELVTLGARPFGAWPPWRVLRYVQEGGRPPLPLDASPQTRGLVALCWRRRPEQRPSAAELGAYLAVNGRALRPTLCWDAGSEVPDADSAFGESPSNESDEPFVFGSPTPPHSPSALSGCESACPK